ncbi:MAG: EboA domain-containing protein [Alphaproteobacteria bacterium]|nr:EboA domain-containing protein [Alphaproteobacteria bacterium]MDP6255556.1 EboA domain-containing protein [Alphaproteobacteria bacterium]HJM94013.1 EboA domain-containing protein [Alphaproteobacteria bacterium]
MTELAQPLELMRQWLQDRLSPDAWGWLSQTIARLENGGADRDLYFAISLVPRKLGKADLVLNAVDLAAADTARSGWRPAGWSVDQAARMVLMLCATPEGAEFARRLEQLCITADVRESIAFYQGLPLYPEPERYIARAGEGARTNMKAVFEAVAHHNPYPSEYFSENAWNQMVLKTIFVGSSLDPIQGLDARRNRDLALTLIDYAHERWAASRTIAPELWRMIGPFVESGMIADLQRALASDVLAERQAAALALRECTHEDAPALLKTVPDIDSNIEVGRVSWETVCREALLL